MSTKWFLDYSYFVFISFYEYVTSNVIEDEEDLPFMIMIYYYRIQAGQLTDAYALLEERLELEEKQLGRRVEDLADIYNIMCKCKSEVDKQSAHEYILYVILMAISLRA